MRNLNRLLVNEWLKLFKKRSFFVPYALLIGMSFIAGYVIQSFMKGMFSSVYDFTATMSYTQGLGQVVTIMAIIGSSGIVAKEYSQGTIKFLLIRARSRTSILASKYITALLYGLSLTLVTGGALFISGSIWFGFSGAEGGWLGILSSLGYSYVYTLVYITLAFMLGILTTSGGATIGITMLMLMLDKTVIQKEFYKYWLFPNLDLSVYRDGGVPLPGMTLSFSIAILAIYVLLFLLAGFMVFRRRDVA
ncbi:ABC transporter permease [Paenibacillus sp. GCM10012306]|uniref:ABC transporter permease n=1 Tax=Paenibacillus sp. GCM10012306 TaxID=3317342 RepID=UPI00360E92F2